MAVTFVDGNVTTNGTEQSLFDVTADKHYASWIFAHNMQAGDTIQVRVYTKDQNDGVMRKYVDAAISDSQTTPAFYIPYIPAKQYKVSIQRTAGTDRAYTWLRAEA